MGGEGLRPGSVLGDLPGTFEDRRSLDQIYSATYEELRRLAAVVRRGSPFITLSPTTIVNEAWMKLAASPGFASMSPLHFKRIAARAMRQVVVEAARRKSARKRGGGDIDLVTLDESFSASPCRPEQVIALDAALSELGRLEPRQAQMVECRFFGGFDVRETAEALQVSEATIHRDWRAAKAWLGVMLRHPS
jgi:RNA polymerase sigma factor (TIGR02999 family)